MPRKKKDSLSAFDDALNEFGFNNPIENGGTTNIDDIVDDTDIDDFVNNDHTRGVNNTSAEDSNGKNDQFEDDTDIPEDILNNINQSDPDEQDNDDPTDPNESNQISMFFDAFAEELGWDVDEDDKPTSVSQLVDYIGQMIEENSTPQYADERVAKLDQYIKNGGNFEDFYHRQQESLSYETLDMEDESNQKAVIREYLRYQGYDDNQISRKIERYEDGDFLEEEAEDAIARLKQIKQEQIAMQQQRQEEARQMQEAQAREFMDNLTNSINSLDSIRGILIPKADRKELFDYITKVDADGLTRYLKDFNENLVNNLIESAYFTMKGDTLINEATRSGRTSAANKLRTMLRHSSTNHSRYNVNENKQRSVVDIASEFYR